MRTVSTVQTLQCLIAAFLAAGTLASEARGDSSACAAGYETLVRPELPVMGKSPETIEELFTAFENNLIPNFSDPRQVQAFLIYRMNKLGDSATGFSHDSIETLAKIQRQHPDLSKHAFRPVAVGGPEGSKTVRPLSFAEAPWRSCLGGDCSSRTYFEKALEEPYHYFTMTDANGRSDGQVTIVLGRAGRDGKLVPTAFVDKVQGIDDKDLPVMFEAIRRSVAADGYSLAVPRELGNTTGGISNYSSTHSWMREALLKDVSPSNELKQFQPENSPVRFDKGFSRAADLLNVIEVKPPAHSMPSLELLPPRKPWKVSHIETEKFFKKIDDLKDGSIEDKIKYLRLRSNLEKLLGRRSTETEVIDAWMRDPSQPLKLKNEIMKFLLQTGRFELLETMRHHLTPAQQGNLIQNLLQSPHSKSLILQNPASTLPMAVAHAPSFGEISAVAPMKVLIKLVPQLLEVDTAYQPNVVRELLKTGNREVLEKIQKVIEGLKARREQSFRAKGTQLEAELKQARVLRQEYHREVKLDGLRRPIVLSDGTIVYTHFQEVLWYRMGQGIVHRLPVRSSVMHDLVHLSDDRVVVIVGNKVQELKDGKVLKSTPIEINERYTISNVTADDRGRVSFRQRDVTYLYENGETKSLGELGHIGAYPPYFAPDGRMAVVDLKEKKIRWYQDGKEVSALEYSDGTGFNEGDFVPNFMTQRGTLILGSTHGTVEWVTPHGIQHTFHTGLPRFFNHHGMALMPDGTVVVGRSTGNGLFSVVWLRDGQIIHEMPVAGHIYEANVLRDGTVRVVLQNGDAVFAKDGRTVARGYTGRAGLLHRDRTTLSLPDNSLVEVSSGGFVGQSWVEPY